MGEASLYGSSDPSDAGAIFLESQSHGASREVSGYCATLKTAIVKKNDIAWRCARCPRCQEAHRSVSASAQAFFLVLDIVDQDIFTEALGIGIEDAPTIDACHLIYKLLQVVTLIQHKCVDRDALLGTTANRA